jgi:hypothetical protein
VRDQLLGADTTAQRRGQDAAGTRPDHHLRVTERVVEPVLERAQDAHHPGGAENAARAQHDAECDKLADQMVALRPHLAELVPQVIVQDYYGAAQPSLESTTISPEVYEAHEAATTAADPGRSN